jgi:hypothetical protein
VFSDHITPKIAIEIPPYAMDMVGIVLRIIKFYQECNMIVVCRTELESSGIGKAYLIHVLFAQSFQSVIGDPA